MISDPPLVPKTDDNFYSRHPHSATIQRERSQFSQHTHTHVLPPPPPPSSLSSSSIMYHYANGNAVAPPFGGANTPSMFRGMSQIP